MDFKDADELLASFWQDRSHDFLFEAMPLLYELETDFIVKPAATRIKIDFNKRTMHFIVECGFKI